MPDYKQNVSDFVPNSKADILAFYRYGIVPEGYLSQDGVAKICEGCAEEMRKAYMPLIREERFVSDINKRVALDIHNNTEAWAKAIATEEDVLDSFRKADYAEVYDLDSVGAAEHTQAEDLQMRKAYLDIEDAYSDLFPLKLYNSIVVPKRYASSAKHYRHAVARARIAKCVGFAEDCEYSVDLMKAVHKETMERRYGTIVDKFKAKLRADKASNLECHFDLAVGTKPSLVDFVKAEPQASISGWAEKMRREGGDHPHSWCAKKAAKFSKDPNAFCAAVHMAAYGKTPSQRKAEKKE
jgi:hypothetical protein